MLPCKHKIASSTPNPSRSAQRNKEVRQCRTTTGPRATSSLTPSFVRFSFRASSLRWKSSRRSWTSAALSATMDTCARPPSDCTVTRPRWSWRSTFPWRITTATASAESRSRSTWKASARTWSQGSRRSRTNQSPTGLEPA